MVLVPKINEQAIFDNLKKRFLDSYIYVNVTNLDFLYKSFLKFIIQTYIGPVLIAINPYKEMPYFTQREVEQYKRAVSWIF